ncbi:MAG TPA: AAA family ATPase [Candidatus Saccharimonadales bacterium]
MKSLSLSQPHVIVMVGVPGSGKSFFAEKFSETFNAPYACLEKITPFAKSATAANHIFEQQVSELLKTRQSIIVEGIAAGRIARDTFVRKAKAAHYEILFVWVQTDPATAKSRALRKAKDSDMTLTSDQYDKIVRQFNAPTAIEKSLVISGKHTYATQAKVVLKRLSAPRAEISTHSAAPVRTEEQPRRRGNIVVR